MTLILRYFFPVFLLLFFLNSFSQQIIRSSLSSYGNSVTETGFRYRSTVGQSSNTTRFSNENITLRQGFQQPFLSGSNKCFSCIYCEFEVFPNPAINNTGIYLHTADEFASIIIKDTQSRICKIYNGNFVSEKFIDVSGLSNGVYFVSVKNNKIHSCSKKLVVLK